MKKNKILKALGLFGCAILLVAVSIAGTMAYMTSTAEVKNTFTVGNVAITMTETKVDEAGYGKPVEGAARVTENKYKLIPGHTYTKDPTIYVTAGSEECWLFVRVVNNIADIEAATTIADQMAANDWTALTGVENVYYHEVVDARSATENIDVKVFESFTVKTDAVVDSYNNVTVEITAYAIQADGFSTAAAAWEAAPAAWKTNP